MNSDDLTALAQLLRERNDLDRRLAALLGRPALAGHIGEWIGAQVFDIELAGSAVNRSSDGVFRGAPRPGASVNIKIYGRREGILDLNAVDPADYYLVLTGPLGSGGSSRGAHRPLSIDAVYLFESAYLHAELTQRGLRIGTASSVRKEYWDAAEVYPRTAHPDLTLTDAQRHALAEFGSVEGPVPATSEPSAGR